MYTLYYSPGACSMAVHVLLNELGQQVKLEDTTLSAGKNRSPEFQKINPRGQVPVLVDGEGHVIREGGAMMVYLCDKYNSPLLPAKGIERATALEWLMFCNATLHPNYSRVFFFTRAKIDEKSKTELLDTVYANINKLWAEVEERLAGRQYLCGDEITAADILLTVIANWSRNFPSIEIGQKTRELFARVIARPSYKQALELEQVEYKVAA